jgi:hypothetical protein
MLADFRADEVNRITVTRHFAYPFTAPSVIPRTR